MGLRGQSVLVQQVDHENISAFNDPFLSRYCEIPRQEYFATFGQTTYTLMQFLTLDDWFGVYNDLIFLLENPNDSNSERQSKRITLFIMIFAYILWAYFVLLNLMIAVLVDNFHQASQSEETKDIIHKQVELEEQKLLQKVEGGMAEISDVNLRARLVKLNSLIGEDSEMNIDEYESSDSELDINETRLQVLENIRMAMSGDTKSTGIQEEPTKKEVSTTHWYYRTLAAIEKHLHVTNDQIVTHDRVISLLVDDPEEVLLV